MLNSMLLGIVITGIILLGQDDGVIKILNQMLRDQMQRFGDQRMGIVHGRMHSTIYKVVLLLIMEEDG